MGITPKQKKFADAYLETGNGTQSVLKAYDTESEEVAASMAVENLRKPKVIEYLELKAEKVSENMVKLALNAESESVQFQASKDILDRAGFKPVEKTQSLNVNVDVKVDPKEKEIADKYADELKNLYANS